MLSPQNVPTLQELQDRVGALESALDQVRRQVEAVGRQVADTPLGPVDHRWQDLEARVEELARASVQQPHSIAVTMPQWAEEATPESDDLDLGFRYVRPSTVVATLPAPATPPSNASREQTMASLVTLIRDAVPDSMRSMLDSSVDAVLSLAREARTLGQKEVEVVLRVSTEGNVEDNLAVAYEAEKQRLLRDLAAARDDTHRHAVVTRDIPALVDVCDTGRRQFDTATPFYQQIEPWLRQLLSLAEIESLEPPHGERYDPSEHNALDLVDTDDDSLKDRIESCRYRGYRYQGELLKKAGVVIYR